MYINAAAKFTNTAVRQVCANYPLSSDLCANDIEQRITRAYVQLVYQSVDPDGLRTVVMMRIGPLEVHLIEMYPEDTVSGMPPFQIKVFDGEGQVPVDSIGRREFDEDELTGAVEIILSAARKAGARDVSPLH
jgi:hypothetical protein